MKTWTRARAIDALRKRLLELTDDEHRACMVAAREQIFCGGFSQWKFGELRDRYGWIAKRRPRITRAKLEDLANRWQLARQFVNDSELSCDVAYFQDDSDERFLRGVLHRMVGRPTSCPCSSVSSARCSHARCAKLGPRTRPSSTA